MKYVGFATTGLVMGLLIGALLQKAYWGYTFRSIRQWIVPDFSVPRFSVAVPILGILIGLLTGLFPLYGKVASTSGRMEILLLGGYLVHLYYFVVLCAIVITSILDDTWVPSVLVVPGIACGLVGSLFIPGFGDQLGLAPLPRNIDSFLSSLAGAAVSYGFLGGIRWIYLKVRNIEAFGLGTLRLAAMIGGYVGLKKGLFVLLCTSVLASIVGLVWLQFKSTWRDFWWLSRHEEMPFSLFQALVGLLTPYIANPIIRWYISLSH